MILIVTTREHRYTHDQLHGEKGASVEVVDYDEILGRRRPLRATHVFTDLDRLAPWRLHQAALLYRALKQAGITALNDPARVLGRFGLLRALNRSGVNSFDAYRVDSLDRPRRWPVFLRTEGDHRVPVSGLLHNAQELDEALRHSLDQGVPQTALLIVEYAAEPVQPGLFRKLSVFRIGERLLGYTCVHEDNWLVKYGKPGIAPLELYEEEYAFVAENPFARAMLPVFELAGIEYGRVDFGLVGGRPEVYEINSNPHVKLRPPPSPIPRRNESTDLFRANYLEAMNAIDSGAPSSWDLRVARLTRASRDAPARARQALGNCRRDLRRLLEGTLRREVGTEAAN